MFDLDYKLKLAICYLGSSLLQPFALGKALHSVSAALNAPQVEVAEWVADASVERPVAPTVAKTLPRGRGAVAMASVIQAKAITVDALAFDLSAAIGEFKNLSSKSRVQEFESSVNLSAEEISPVLSVHTQPLAGLTRTELVAVRKSVVVERSNAPRVAAVISSSGQIQKTPKIAASIVQSKKLTVTVTINMDLSISVIPETIQLSEVGNSLQIEKRSLAGAAALEKISVFIRDSQILSLNESGQTITALAPGESEIIVTGNGKMTVAKIKVGGNLAFGLASLEIPAEITNLLPSSSGSGFKSEATDRASRSLASPPMSLEESKRKAEETLENYSQQSKQFAREAVDVGYKEVVLQLLDERSVPSKGIIFPVGGVTVSLLGTEFSGLTSATGHFTIPNVPINSRFLIGVSNRTAGYVSMISEFSTNSSGDSQLIQLPALRSFTFENSATVAGVVQRETLGSLCATVYNEDGSSSEGATIVTDQEAEGPFFFNRFGFLDRTLQATGPNGRFCMFNITAGPMAVEVYGSVKSLSGLVPTTVFTGRHTEEEIVLGDKGKIRTRLAAMATVHEQLSNDSTLQGAYRSVDIVDLIPLGSEDALTQVESGLAISHYPLMAHNDRIFALSRTSEFEPTIYSYGIRDDVGVGEHVTPLIPRGFVEDMAIFAQVSLNFDLGTVVAEHGDVKGQTQGATKLKLLDERGNPAGQGWYYGDSPLTKAIFFNVNPGKYLIMTETSEGYWLAVDTVIVYSRTVSYIRTGARTRFR